MKPPFSGLADAKVDLVVLKVFQRLACFSLEIDIFEGSKQKEVIATTSRFSGFTCMNPSEFTTTENSSNRTHTAGHTPQRAS